MSKQVFLVTGAGGFIGANLCRRLVAAQEEVHIFLRPTTSRWRIEDLAGSLHIHEADICDADRVDELVAAIRPTVVYHLATHGAYHHQTDAESILLTNVFGFWNLIHACNRHGYELFVNTGSSSEYGRKTFAMREIDNLEPDSYYAVAKSAQSLLARHCSHMSDLPVVIMRLFSVYGPYEEPTRLIPRLMMAAIDGEPIDMAGPSTARDFVYVDDVIDAYLDVEKLGQLRGEILNVGTGVQSSLAQVVEVVQSLLGRELAVRWGRMASRTWDSDVWVADVSKLRRLTGAEPGTTLRRGLEQCLAWFSEHAGLYRQGNGRPC